ncbi:hypothetical protein CLTEP_12770 [Clostridium tepidiprofundi DSM 19306]|uniref:VOC domain-containing protein n=1 Tax=Clostridium tepidiprofundi DSM 19306 TaxID=1121338 RepID=A0A151B4X6_9CLOT|nr:VOC family protein [Clostridium tepidiprofundi]KYH34812.1 hypothetical protein CLTEP_12770 [Clostridium tepidiprofundi DSM 19306]
MNIDHIGYIVKDIEKSILEFEYLGYKREDKTFKDLKRRIYIQFMKNNGHKIELVSPLEKGSPIDDILKRQGEGAYHICYVVDDIYDKISQLKDRKYIVIQIPHEAIAF